MRGRHVDERGGDKDRAGVSSTPATVTTDAALTSLRDARDKIRRNAEKYPVDKARGSSRKYTDL